MIINTKKGKCIQKTVNVLKVVLDPDLEIIVFVGPAGPDLVEKQWQLGSPRIQLSK